MAEDIKELFIKSFKNRQDFLKNKYIEWLECKNERKKTKIIIKLIQLEPSHLAESWVLDQVIKWMKDFEKNLDTLKEVFIAKGVRDTLTEKQRENLAKSTFQYFKVEKLAKTKGSRGKAIRAIVNNSDDDSLPGQAETAIKQALKRYKKRLDKRLLPYPYYGHDVLLVDKGTDQERLEVYTKNMPIIMGDAVFFGDTIEKYPVIK